MELVDPKYAGYKFKTDLFFYFGDGCYTPYELKINLNPDSIFCCKYSIWGGALIYNLVL